MSKFRELRLNPPALIIKEGAREVIFNLVSVMCDNRKKISLRKDADGYFALRTHGDHWSNFGIKCDFDDITWAADDGNWDEVIAHINGGHVQIEAVKSR